jgi:hypothetical protein
VQGFPSDEVEASRLLDVPRSRITREKETGWQVTEGAVLTIKIPTGVCVDFNPAGSQLTGAIARSKTMAVDGRRWQRALTSGPAVLQAVGATLWWSYCDWDR